VSNERITPLQFDPKNQQETGIEVLRSGLPDLPGTLTREMSIPIACWEASNSAVVLFLRYLKIAGASPIPIATIGLFYRHGQQWLPHVNWASTGWSHDPVADQKSLSDLDGQAIVGGCAMSNPQASPGIPVAVMTGRVSPAITSIALVQGDRVDRRPLQSHFGAWVVCAEEWSPFQIDAADDAGTVVGTVTGPLGPITA
jgi:hypothetical protein